MAGGRGLVSACGSPSVCTVGQVPFGVLHAAAVVVIAVHVHRRQDRVKVCAGRVILLGTLAVPADLPESRGKT